MFLKICGITQGSDLQFVMNQSAICAVGFIAYPKSPRYISSCDLKVLLNNNSCDLCKVGVFVNEELSIIREYIDAGIDVIQLHGNESAQFAEECAKYAEVWKAIAPQKEEDIAKYANYPANKFLIDAFSKTEYGGTGRLANWEVAQVAKEILSKDIILAGGINSSNITSAICAVKPYGIDLSSGVEISPGIKDYDKIIKLLKKLNEEN